MIEITTLAAKKLSTYLLENKITSPVRITTMNGCSGPSLGLALGEPKDDDHVHKNEMFTLLIDRELSQSCGKVTVDYLKRSSGGGFSIASTKPLPSTGCGCGSSCSSNGCGC